VRRLADLVRRLFRKGEARSSDALLAGARVHVPVNLLRQLRDITRPNQRRPEPLALLQARYASESAREVVVGLGALAFPESAYLSGPGSVNFDTDWLVRTANREIAANVGLLLVHSHGGSGSPAFSSVDRRTNERVMAPLAIGVDVAPYGALVLSDTHANAVVTVAGVLVAAEVIAVPDALDGFEVTA
jgi:hypothetical protein